MSKDYILVTKNKKNIYFIIISLLLNSGCQSNRWPDLQIPGISNTYAASRLLIKGKVEFPVPALKGNNAFNINAVPVDIANQATVSIIYPPDASLMANVTVATGLTTPEGAFTLNPGTDFHPTAGDSFILEATKRIGGGGKDSLSLRTMLRWSGTEWNSITFPGVVINTKTTALTLMAEYRNTSSASIINKIQIIGNSYIPLDVNSQITGIKISKVAELVAYALENNGDPEEFIKYDVVKDNYYIGSPVSISQSAIITTVAGGYTGSNVHATSAALVFPEGLAIDNNGNLFIADNNSVLKVDTNGILTTIAGDESSGFSGDGGPATAAKLKYPNRITFDTTGNMYISDKGNYRIRKISPDGIITTVAGNGGNVYAGDGGPATAASMYIEDIAMDNNSNLFIAGNGRVRKVNSNGIITTVVSGFSASSIAFDNSGDLYIADKTNNQIKKLDSQQVISSYATYNFYSENYNRLKIAFDQSGNLYISDGKYNLDKIDVNKILSSIAGTRIYGFSGDGGPAVNAQFQETSGLVFDSNSNLYVSDSVNHRVRKIDNSGIINTIAGGYVGDNQPATLTGFCPGAIAFDSIGNIYISEFPGYRVRKIDSNGIITTFAGNGTSGFNGDGGPATEAKLYGASDLAFDKQDNLYISDFSNFRIRKVDRNGIISTVAGNGNIGSGGDGGYATSASFNDLLAGVAIDDNNNLFISDGTNNKVRKVDINGIITTFAGNGNYGSNGDGSAATRANLNFPGKLSIDKNGNLFISDNFNRKIRKVDANGIITTVAGDTFSQGIDGGPAVDVSLSSFTSNAVDNLGNLYISDNFNFKIRKVDTGGIITTIAGNGIQEYNGDNIPATAASFFPSDIAIDKNGNIFFSDSRRLRKMSF
jgi:sugar lactone lactonase YvrE